MLGLHILVRAAIAPFKFWRTSLILGLPYIGVMLLYRTILGQIDMDSLAFVLNLCALLALTTSLSATVAIAWHRTLLSETPLGLWVSLRHQPRLHYAAYTLIIAIGMMLLLPSVLVGLRQLPILLTTENLNANEFSKFLIGLILIVFRDSESFFFLLFFTILGVGLPGLAIGTPVPFQTAIQFSFRNLYYIFMASFAASAGLFLINWQIEFVLLQQHQVLTPTPPFVPVRLITQWFAILVAIGLQTEFYRELRADQHRKTKAPQE